MHLKQKFLIGLLLVAFCCNSSVESNEVDCDEYMERMLSSSENFELSVSHPELIGAYQLRNKNSFACFDFIVQLLILSNKETTSLPENNQVKRQLAQKASRRKMGNKYLRKKN